MGGGGLVAKSCLTLRTPWTVARQAPLFMGFSRQECWSGWPFPSPGDLPNPGMKPKSPALQEDSLLTEPPGKPEGTHRAFSPTGNTCRFDPPRHTLVREAPAWPWLSGHRPGRFPSFPGSWGLWEVTESTWWELKLNTCMASPTGPQFILSVRGMICFLKQRERVSLRFLNFPWKHSVSGAWACLVSTLASAPGARLTPSAGRGPMGPFLHQ